MSVKIGIIGDVHLGANLWAGKQHPTLNVNTRQLDYAETLDITIKEMILEGVTELVFTGDIFEHRVPTVLQQKLFSQCLHNALSNGIETIHICIGNHDQQRQNTATTLSYLKELNLPNIRVYDEMSIRTIMWYGKPAVNLVIMPYRDRLWLEANSHDEAIDKLRFELKGLLDSRDRSVPTLLVGHMATEGTFIDEGDKDLYGENQLTLPFDMFNDIDITIFGHVHKPAVMCEKPYVAYVGSMEKRGAHESHNKVYVIIDLATRAITYKNEPCRDLWDISLDYSSMVVGEDLQATIFADIALFAQDHKLEGSIVKPLIRISAEDEQHLDSKKIVAYIRDNFAVNFCADLKPEIITARQSRDDRITEDISHISAFTMYLENSVEDKTLLSSLIEAGAEIIRSVGEKHATH